ncbi:MAG: hypothetical protein ACTSRI_02825 [Promethearchaeota archaeon]
MNYSHLYWKLKNNLYTTIRKKCNEKIGSIVSETYNYRPLHEAKIIAIDKIKLSQLPLSVLLMDCYYGNSSIRIRQDCYALFQSFYKKPINFSKQFFYLILLEKINII